MGKLRLLVTCVAVLGLFVLLNGFETTDESLDAPRQLGVMFETNGTFTEFTFDLTPDELADYFGQGVAAQILEGERVHLSSEEGLAGVLDLVGVVEGSSIDNIWVLYARTVTWTCIKCCFHDPVLSCCCPEKDED